MSRAVPRATTGRCRATTAASLGLALLASSTASAASGSAKADLDPDWANAPSARYASLERDACLAELRSRAIKFELVSEAPGVVTPVRAVDGIGGVLYRTAQPRDKRVSSPHDVFDCRLVLALHDLSALLLRHGIDEVLMFSGWRPPPKGWPADKAAVRHPGAMAIDVFKFGRWVDAADPTGSTTEPQAGTTPTEPPPDAKKDEPKKDEPKKDDPKPTPEAASSDAKAAARPADGKRIREWLDVKEHFQGEIGAITCGPDAPAVKLGPEPTRLRAIVCEAAAKRLFTTILTPNCNRAHHNHVHLDLAPGARWRLVR
jgi:hypothetical protein